MAGLSFMMSAIRKKLSGQPLPGAEQPVQAQANTGPTSAGAMLSGQGTLDESGAMAPSTNKKKVSQRAALGGAASALQQGGLL